MPGFWEMMKYAWVQYLSVVFIIYYVILWAQDFIFTNGVLPTTGNTPRNLHHNDIQGWL